MNILKAGKANNVDYVILRVRVGLLRIPEEHTYVRINISTPTNFCGSCGEHHRSSYRRSHWVCISTGHTLPTGKGDTISNIFETLYKYNDGNERTDNDD